MRRKARFLTTTCFAALVLATALVVPAAGAALPKAHPAAAIVAQEYLDYPYAAGGTSAEGFDAPGFVCFSYLKFPLDCAVPATGGDILILPHSLNGLVRRSVPLNRRQLKPGDLIFFRQAGRRLVGIYTGQGALAYASPQAGRVVYALVPWKAVIDLRRARPTAVPYIDPTIGDSAMAVSVAQRYLGCPFLTGGASPSGFDAAGLTMYVYAQLGAALPHGITAQQQLTIPVSLPDLRPGELVFFGSAEKSTHVGIYVGGGSMIDASPTGGYVRYDGIAGAWIAGRVPGLD